MTGQRRLARSNKLHLHFLVVSTPAPDLIAEFTACK